MNEIDDFKQYMDVTYIVEIGWKDHRIMNFGDCLIDSFHNSSLETFHFLQAIIVIVVALLTLTS